MEKGYTNADTDSMRTNEGSMMYIVPLRQPDAYQKRESLSPTDGQFDSKAFIGQGAPTYLANVQSNPVYNSTQVSDRQNVITEGIPQKSFTFGRNNNLVMSATAANFFDNVPLD